MSDDLPSKLDIDLLNAKYVDYKKSIEDALGDESDDDGSYKETFVDEYSDEFDDEEGEDEVSEADEEYKEQSVSLLKPLMRLTFRLKKHWIVILTILGIIIVNYILWNRASLPIISNDLSRSLNNLQWQINELNTKQKSKYKELKNYLDLKLDDINSRFISIDKDIKQLKLQNKELLNKINELSVDNISIDSSRVPVILDDENNVQLLPEFKAYLQSFIKASLSSDIPQSFKLDMERFIQDHVHEILNNKVGYMQKDEILHLISRQFQENKRKLIDEIKQLTSIRHTDVPSRLIPNELKQQRKIDYAQASNGARIINYLSTPSFKPKTKGWFRTWISNIEAEEEDPSSPFIILTPNQGFWKSQVATTLGIKFLEPVYMNEFQYEHQRVMNSALLTSCPKTISLYVLGDDMDSLRRYSPYPDHIGKYQKVIEMQYDLNGGEVQSVDVPEWMKKILVKSILINVEDNYGNEFFTSLFKFHIHGITKFDLLSVEKLISNEQLNEGIKRSFRTTVKRFGDDDKSI
jgi:hypothetical protein